MWESSSPCSGINRAPSLIHHSTAEIDKRCVWNACAWHCCVCECVCEISTHDSVQLVPHGRQCPVALLYFHTVCWSSFTPLGQWSTQRSPSWKFRHSTQCSAPWRHTQRRNHIWRTFQKGMKRSHYMDYLRLFILHLIIFTSTIIWTFISVALEIG